MNEDIVVKIDPILAELVPKFLARTRQSVVDLRSATDAADLTPARRIGHSLFGTASSYGFDEMAAIGKDIERAAQVGDRGKLGDLAERLEKHLDRVRPVFESGPEGR